MTSGDLNIDLTLKSYFNSCKSFNNYQKPFSVCRLFSRSEVGRKAPPPSLIPSLSEPARNRVKYTWHTIDEEDRNHKLLIYPGPEDRRGSKENKRHYQCVPPPVTSYHRHRLAWHKIINLLSVQISLRISGSPGSAVICIPRPCIDYTLWTTLWAVKVPNMCNDICCSGKNVLSCQTCFFLWVVIRTQ